MKSILSMVGRWVVSATCSGPFFLRDPARASRLDQAGEPGDAAGRGPLGVGDALGPQGVGDLLHEPVRVEALEGLVGAPRREPRRPTGHRAEPGHGLDRQLLQAFAGRPPPSPRPSPRGRGERGAGVLRAVRLVAAGRAALPDQGREVEVEQRVEARPVGGRFTSVAAYVARRVSRSASPRVPIAVAASTSSASETGTPAARRASTKPMWRSVSGIRRRGQPVQSVDAAAPARAPPRPRPSAVPSVRSWVGRACQQVAPGLGDLGVDAAAVGRAQVPLQQLAVLQPVHQPGRRGLAQHDRVRQLIHPQVVVVLPRQHVEHAVLAHGQAVLLLQRALQFVLDPGMQSGQGAPPLRPRLGGIIAVMAHDSST